MAFAAMGESGVDHCPPQEPALAKAGEVWSEEHARWQKRDLSAKRYVYCWADGIHLEARLEEQAQCILVIIGTTPEGRKELVGFTDGIRESSQSWRDLLLDLKRRGLTTAPQIAVAGARSGSGRPSARCGRRPASNAAGCTRPPTS
jgi:transposase-like protein